MNMDPMAIMAVVEEVMTAAQVAMKVEQEATPFVKLLYDHLIKGTGEVTPEDVTAVRAGLAKMSADLQQDLPDDSEV